MTKLDLVKGAVGFVVGAGVAQIVNGFVERVAPTDTPVQKVLVFAGRTGISMLITDAVREHMNDKIDATVEWLQTELTEDVKTVPIDPSLN